MSLFQCEVCGCCENTALSMQGFKGITECYDWSYAPEREGKRICSACGPVKHRDGTPTKFGKWHDQFRRVFLPLGMFETNSVGNLAHKETGDENFRAYALPVAAQPMPVKVSWYAKGQTIVAKAFIGDRLAHRAEHEFPRTGTLALFELVIGCMTREVAENAR